MKRAKLCCAAALATLFAMGGAVAQDATQPNSTGPVVDPLAVQQEFTIDKSTRMTVPVRINGSEPYPFIVDTGAERTVIANDLARTLALASGPKLTLATITGQTKVDSYVIDRLATTAVNVEGLEAPGLERYNLGAYGLLGIDSLEQHRVLLDFKRGTMDVLPSPKTKKKTKIEDGMIVVTAVRKAGRMILSSATIDGMKVDVILDTGAQGSMGNLALRKRLNASRRTMPYVDVKIRSVTGEMLHGQFTQIKDIEIGKISIQALPIIFSDNYAFEALDLKNKPAIMLGMDAMKMFDRVMIDFANRKVGFDMPGHSSRQTPYQLAALLPSPPDAKLR